MSHDRCPFCPAIMANILEGPWLRGGICEDCLRREEFAHFYIGQCRRGHKYTPETTRVTVNKRWCKTCEKNRRAQIRRRRTVEKDAMMTRIRQAPARIYNLAWRRLRAEDRQPLERVETVSEMVE